MKRLMFLTGLLAFAVPSSVRAQSTFDLFYSYTEPETTVDDLPPGLADFVIEEMRHWQGNGIVLTKDDITAAMQEVLWTEDENGLCQNKQSVEGGITYQFVQGGNDSAASCMGLLHDLQSLINAEREISSLATDLLGIAGGAEASIADEPGRAVDMASTALILRRVWSGTGAAAIPWDKTAQGKLDDLDNRLASLSPEELDQAMIRFRHGLYRDQREADPRFSGVQDGVKDDLQTLADHLGVVDDPLKVGVFVVPSLVSTRNVQVWIRKNDIGLLYIYPTHFPRFEFKQADEYPVIANTGSGTLAYPFEYEGSSPSDPARYDSPLCSRVVGKQGYLCRPVTPPEENCPLPAASDKITLVKCEEKTFVTKSGPRICPDFRRMFDNDPNLTDPSNPGKLNPSLVATNTGSVCTPEEKVIYQDDIESHACYIGFCMLQSLSGHTIIPNRNPVLINEATSPYLACIRPDPQLGLYTELVENSPYPLPEYIGPFLVREFERRYCAVNGSAPKPLLGLCRYNDNYNAELPLNLYSESIQFGIDEQQAIGHRQNMQDLIATLAGQRAALDQSVEVQRKVFAKLANFIQQTASLLLELKNGSLTKTPCPWTGQFKSSTPAP